MTNDLVTFYFSFKGRATRYDFNVKYAIVAAIGMMAAALIDVSLFGMDSLDSLTSVSFSNAWQLIILVPTIAVTARRLHDVNMSGWWQVVGYIGPVILALVMGRIAGVTDVSDPTQALSALPALIGGMVFFIVFFLFISMKSGTKGPNKYGADPLEAQHVGK